MGNLVPQSGGTAVATTGANPWAEAARGVETGSYLKFNGNDGRYSFGQDDEDLPAGSRVVGDMETLAFGWMCWVDSNVEEEILVPVLDGKPPMEHELTDHGPYDEDDGWREAASLSLVLESYGDDDQDEAVGTQLLWKTSTGGQVRQFKKLSGAYGRVFSQHPGEFPIIELGAESYVPKVKKHGKLKWSPALKIVGWISAEELEGLTGGAAGDDFEEPTPRGAAKQIEEAPPARGRRAAAEPVDEPEEAPPVRGRRQVTEPADEPEDEAPPPRRGRSAPPVDDVADEDVAPEPRGRRRAAPANEPEDEPAPPVRGRRSAAPAADEGDEAPPARSTRGAPPANARLRRFD